MSIYTEHQEAIYLSAHASDEVTVYAGRRAPDAIAAAAAGATGTTVRGYLRSEHVEIDGGFDRVVDDTSTIFRTLPALASAAGIAPHESAILHGGVMYDVESRQPQRNGWVRYKLRRSTVSAP